MLQICLLLIYLIKLSTTRILKPEQGKEWPRSYVKSCQGLQFQRPITEIGNFTNYGLKITDFTEQTILKLNLKANQSYYELQNRKNNLELFNLTFDLDIENDTKTWENQREYKHEFRISSDDCDNEVNCRVEDYGISIIPTLTVYRNGSIILINYVSVSSKGKVNDTEVNNHSDQKKLYVYIKNESKTESIRRVGDDLSDEKENLVRQAVNHESKETNVESNEENLSTNESNVVINRESKEIISKILKGGESELKELSNASKESNNESQESNNESTETNRESNTSNEVNSKESNFELHQGSKESNDVKVDSKVDSKKQTPISYEINPDKLSTKEKKKHNSNESSNEAKELNNEAKETNEENVDSKELLESNEVDIESMESNVTLNHESKESTVESNEVKVVSNQSFFQLNNELEMSNDTSKEVNTETVIGGNQLPDEVKVDTKKSMESNEEDIESMESNIELNNGTVHATVETKLKEVNFGAVMGEDQLPEDKKNSESKELNNESKEANNESEESNNELKESYELKSESNETHVKLYRAPMRPENKSKECNIPILREGDELSKEEKSLASIESMESINIEVDSVESIEIHHESNVALYDQTQNTPGSTRRSSEYCIKCNVDLPSSLRNNFESNDSENNCVEAAVEIQSIEIPDLDKTLRY